MVETEWSCRGSLSQRLAGRRTGGKDCMFRGVCVCGFFKLGGGQKLVEDGLGRPAGREGALEERR